MENKEKRILIISSELLNPNHIIDSTFELTQAQILSKSYETAVISVQASGTIISIIKSLIKKALFISNSKNEKASQIISQLIGSIIFVFFKRKIVNKYLIENVVVYESIGYTFNTLKTFEKQINFWVKVGLNAYDQFEKENNRPDIIYSHGRFLKAGLLALMIKEKHKINYTYTEYCTFYRENLAPKESIPILNRVLDNASAFICISPGLLEDVEKFLNRKFPKAHIIPIGLDKVFETILPKQLSNEKQFVFTNIAFLHHRKRHEIIIKAFKEAFNGDKKYRLNIIGDGPLLEKLTQLAKELDIQDCVFFLGKIDKKGVKEILDKSHASVLASKDETLGVVVYEALARGIPVVATRCGGPEYIIKDFCGILVDPDDIDGLAFSMKNIVTNYKKYDRLLIRSYALENYGTDFCFNAFEKIYNQAI